MAAQAESPALQAKHLPAGEKGKSPGRKTTYTPATAELICARLCDGETLTEICRTPGMPRRQTVHQWRMRFPAFDDMYARARAVGMESMSDEILTIADDDTGDTLRDGSPNSASVQRSRLMVDTRKFLMSKLAPKVYGDRVEVEHSGTVEQRVTLSDRERMRRLATFLAQDARAGALIDGQAETIEQPASPALPASDNASDSPPLDEPRASQDDF